MEIHDRKCIMHVITSLDTGGAEMMLTKLVCASDQQRYKVIVVSLTSEGTMGETIKACNVEVESIGMKKGKVSLGGLLSLIKLIRREQPDLIMGWMYHANIAVLFAKLMSAIRMPLVWNVRHTPYQLSKEKRITSMLIKLGAYLSFLPNCIVYNSNVSLNRHIQLGFSAKNSLMIPNGFNTNVFKPSSSHKKSIRNILGIPQSALALVHVARFHPMKDHKMFLHSASLILKKNPSVYFVLVGKGVSWDNLDLCKWIDLFDLRDQILLIGERTNLHELLPAFNGLCLTSAWGEGFPNVIGEAMACGIPCVTTNVGDAGDIVGDEGYVVPPDDPIALADSCNELLALNTKTHTALGKKAREKIIMNYSLDAIALRYQSLYENILT